MSSKSTSRFWLNLLNWTSSTTMQRSILSKVFSTKNLPTELRTTRTILSTKDSTFLLRTITPSLFATEAFPSKDHSKQYNYSFKSSIDNSSSFHPKILSCPVSCAAFSNILFDIYLWNRKASLGQSNIFLISHSGFKKSYWLKDPFFLTIVLFFLICHHFIQLIVSWNFYWVK